MKSQAGKQRCSRSEAEGILFETRVRDARQKAGQDLRKRISGSQTGENMIPGRRQK